MSLENPSFDLCRCVECLRHFPASEVLSFRGASVCAACKPVAVAKLESGRPLGTFWRRGTSLIVVRTEDDIEFPERCIVCNAPAAAYKVRPTSPVKPPPGLLVALVLVVGGLMFIPSLPSALQPLVLTLAACVIPMLLVVARIQGKRFRWQYSLCHVHWRRRRLGLGAFFALSAVGGTAIVFGAGQVLDWLVMLGAACVGIGLVMMVPALHATAGQHTPTHRVFQRCGRPFLAQFPEWPEER